MSETVSIRQLIYFEYSMTEWLWQPKGNGIFKEDIISLSVSTYIPMPEPEDV